MESTAIEFKEKGFNTIGLPIDVTDRKSVENTAAKIFEIFGRIDILVNNAGVVYKPLQPGGSVSIPMANVSYENWKRVIDVNVLGVFNCSQIFGRIMIPPKGAGISSTSLPSHPWSAISADEITHTVHQKVP